MVRFRLDASQLYQDVEIPKGKLMKGQLIGSQFMQQLNSLAAIIQVPLLPLLLLSAAVEIEPLLPLTVLLLTVLVLTVLPLTVLLLLVLTVMPLTVLLLLVLLEAGIVLLLIISLLLPLMHGCEVAVADATAALSCGATAAAAAAVLD